jgi:1,4-alpha-glucan branching enzyme
MKLHQFLSIEERDALAHGTHAQAAERLGFHALPPSAQKEQSHFVAHITQAKAAELLGAEGASLAMLERTHKAGIFEVTLDQAAPAAYSLRVTWANGDKSDIADAYAFAPDISDEDLYFLGEGKHLRPYEVLGAHLQLRQLGQQKIPGTRFSLWAPNAQRASVVGSFNAWDGRRHPMRRRGSSGIWELFVPHVQAGDLYKFELTNSAGELLPLKSDPMAFAAQMRPDTASVVAPLPVRHPTPEHRAAANRRDAAVSIYEVHLGSWARAEDGGFLSWKELAERISAHAVGLGFTHIELLPITEHPFDGSWGYQCLGMFAPTSRHGSPEGFREFVDICQTQGLGVILDWVPAHFPKDAHGLARFDGTALYEYADPKEGEHKDWGTNIYNFSRYEVCNFLVGSALFWPERYGVDGLRVDAVASMLYRDYSREGGQWVPNAHGGRENLEAIAFMKRFNEVLGAEIPAAMTLAEESTAFPGVSQPTFAGGLGFHFKWNMGWMNDTLRYMQEDPVHRQWHHDKMSFGLVYAFSENFVLPLSHDEVVHGKGSILGRMPGDDWQRFANLRVYYGFMWGHPGKKLLFMGQEFAQPTEWNHNESLPWQLTQDPKHAGVMALVRDLNNLYRQQPALHQWDCDSNGFEWVDPHDSHHSVYSWVRKNAAGQKVLVVCNFTPVVRHGFRVGVPSDDSGHASWREVLNTDAAMYGGSGTGNGGQSIASNAVPWNGREQSVVITVPPLAALYFLAE